MGALGLYGNTGQKLILRGTRGTGTNREERSLPRIGARK